MAKDPQQSQQQPPKRRRRFGHINVVLIIGSLCKVPVFTVSRAGKPMATLTVAIDRPEDVPPKVGEGGVLEADYPVVIAQGDIAEELARVNPQVGQTIVVVGIYQTRNYVKDGARHTANEILARRAWVMAGEPAQVQAQVEAFLTGLQTQAVVAPQPVPMPTEESDG